jgi:hypothetical protein
LARQKRLAFVADDLGAPSRKHIMTAMRLAQSPSPRGRAARFAVPILLLALFGLALALRLWRLNEVPPGLWWDEATQGLDAAELLRGQFRIFYPSALGKEPLYIYLTAPFVAAWYGTPFAVRIAGALLSALMLPALFAAGRALFPDRPAAGAWAGIAAGVLWATNFWAQSISRIGFQVNALPLLLTVAVVAWLNYARRPSRKRAISFGIIAGLTLYTYLSARITPLLWVVLFVALPADARRRLMPSLRYALPAFALVALPLAAHFALHPADFFGRISTFSVAQGAAALAPPEPLRWSVEGSLKTFFGLLGDPIARHNLPDEPSFTLLGAGLFALGLALGVAAILLRRHQGALTVIAWWLILCLPAILSRSSTPHYPRLLGALPAAILIAALPFGYAASTLRGRYARAGSALLAVALAGALILETQHVTQAYFVRWAQETDLYGAYQQDTWAFAEQVKADGDAVGVIPLNEGYGAQLDYAFAGAPIFQLDAGEGDVGAWLAARLGGEGGRRVMSAAWGEGANQDADSRRVLQHYLDREGELLETRPFRGFDLLTHRLGEQPQFGAAGQSVPVDARFDSGATLVGAQWGAAWPNADRSAASAAAGTPLWATLTWRLDADAPAARAALDLLDAEGHRLGSAEMDLLDLRRQRAGWQAGDIVQTYHLVEAPATLPPGRVTLAARLYDAATGRPALLTEANAADRLSVPLAQAEVTQAASAPVVAPGRVLNYPFARGVTLLGADEWPATVRPGEKLTLRLYWQVTEPLVAPAPVMVAAERDGELAGRAEIALPVGLRAPAVVHTDVDLPVSPHAAGAYSIHINGRLALLDAVNVAGRQRVFEAPPLAQPVIAAFGSAVTLEGVDAPAEIIAAPGETITVTLVWKAVGPPAGDLARFAHVLGEDGRPVAQRDSQPCAGYDAAPPDAACPSASWLAGEYLVDTVAVTLPADLPPGRYPVAAGWYNAASLSRLPAVDGTGARLPDDLLRLPVVVVVEGGG